MKNPMNPMNRRPSPVIMTTRLYSSAVGLRAILRTRPYRPLPRRFARSSIRRCTAQLLSTISAMSPHYVNARFASPKPLAGPVDLLRLHAREDQHHPEPVLEGRVDRRAPDDPRVRGDPRLHDLRDLLRLAHGHVRAPGHVHERTRRPRDVDVDQGRVDRFLDRLLRAAVALPPPHAGPPHAPAGEEAVPRAVGGRRVLPPRPPRRPPPALGRGPGPGARRHGGSEENLGGSPNGGGVLPARVRRVYLRPDDPRLDEPVDRV